MDADTITSDVLGIEIKNGRFQCCHRQGQGWGKTDISEKEAQAYLRFALSMANIGEEVALDGGGLRLLFNMPMVKLTPSDVMEVSSVPRTATAVLLLGK